MDVKSVWWNKLAVSTELIEGITDALYEKNTVLVNCLKPVPYEDTFFETVKRAISGISSVKTLEVVNDDVADDPGEIILKRFCSAEVQSRYWIDDPYAKFFYSEKSIPLHKRYVWIRGVEGEERLDKWLAFVREYNSFFENDEAEERAIFIFESSTGKFSRKRDMGDCLCLEYNYDDFDVYKYSVFCVSGLEYSSLLKQYLAELVLSLSDNNVELCGALATHGFDLAQNTLEVFSKEADKKGKSFKASGVGVDDYVKSKMIMAQTKIVFPVLEATRSEIIKKYYSSLCGYLPLRNVFGEAISEPFDLEWTELRHLLNRIPGDIPEKHVVEECRLVRNQIAHNNVLSYSKILQVLQA